MTAAATSEPSEPSEPWHRRFGWVGVLTLASVLWAGGGLIATGAPMSGPQFAMWGALGGAATYQVVLAFRGRPPRLAALRASALAGLGFGLSVLFLFQAFRTTTLTSANVIAGLQPILLGVAATRLHGIVIPRAGKAAMAVAIVGTLIVVAGSRGGGTWSLRGDLLALGGMLAGCLYPFGTKSARRTLDALEFQAACLWVAALVCLAGVTVVDGGPVAPPADAWWWIAGMVAVGGSGHLLFSWAQHHVSVASAAVILMTEIVASAIGAAIFYDQPIRALQVLGMAVVMAGIATWVRAEAAVAGDEDADPTPEPAV